MFLICAQSTDLSGMLELHFFTTILQSPSKIILFIVMVNPNLTALWHARASASNAEPTPLLRTALEAKTTPEASLTTIPELNLSSSLPYDTSKLNLVTPAGGENHLFLLTILVTFFVQDCQSHVNRHK